MASAHRPRLGASHLHLAAEGGLAGLEWLARLAIVALAVEIAYLVLASPRFAIRTIELRGDPELAAQIAPRISLPRNTNFLLAPTRRLARQVADVPAVRRVRVAHDFPGQLVVTVEKREAIAVIRGGEQAMLVDPEGVIYTIHNEWGWGLPELVGPHLTTQDAVRRSEVAKLVAVLRALGPDPRLGVARLELERGDEITAVLESGAEVRLGTQEEMPAKIKLLRTVIDQFGADQIASLDLSDPGAAYWRPRRERVSVAR